MRLLRIAICPLLVAAALSAQAPSGSSYVQLRPQQQKLVNAWIAEYNKITRKQLDPKSYDSLPLSTRTTFDAVTHALLNTPLTNAAGKRPGTALDLVQLVEAAHGQIPEVRGDRQFRLYVKLKPGALDRLYQSREFKRGKDNTVYHIGYPINFRQQGGTPSIQISVTRTGRRADIDVDYRSSRGPVALVNGHLTAANSDVRAGKNSVKHASRWNGFENWWRDLLGLFAPPKETIAVALDTPIAVQPRIKDSEPLEEAVADHFQTWLVDGAPEKALPYISIRSYACLAEFQTGEDIDSGLATLRILEHMRKGLAAYGKSADLTEVIQAVPLQAPGARPVKNSREKLFTLERLTPEAARQLDCRVRQNLTLAEAIPDSVYEEAYGAVTRLIREKGAPTYLTQVWTKEEGYWKIITWEIGHPFEKPETRAVTAVASTAAKPAAGFVPDPALLSGLGQFFDLWIGQRQYAAAGAFFAPEASACEDVGGSPAEFLKSIGQLLPKKGAVADLISAVPFGHDHMREVAHPASKQYLLARVSDELAGMSECNAAGPLRSEGQKAPTFRQNRFQTIFRLGKGAGTPASVRLQWAKRGADWRITSADIVDR